MTTLNSGISSRFLNQFRQGGLLIGIGFKNMLHPQSFQHLSNRNFIRDLIEISSGAGMILVTGHGGCAVFHQNEGNRVAIENRIDDPRKSGMIKCRIAQKSHNLALRIKERQPCADAGGCPHAHQKLAHLIGRKKSQGMAANVRNGNVRIFQGFFNGVKCAAMAAARA